jgi:cell fate (sporulation/competence/biofilm development) regulator YlbF (YheA/YmcA/DUF963 family)
MAVNIHDSAYDLEKAIRNSDDYKNLKSLYDAVNSDEVTKSLFQSFRNMQLDLQQKQMMGQEISEADVAEAQKVVAEVQQNEKIAQLMQAEERMSTVITELNQIILKPLEELYGAVGQ